MLFVAAGLRVATFESAAAFLEAAPHSTHACLVLDVRMPRMSGLTLQEKMHKRRLQLPIIFITGHGDVPMAVGALKRGAVDFMEKPVDAQRLLFAVMNALRVPDSPLAATVDGQVEHPVQKRIETLTHRERQVLEMILIGKQSREIAAKLFISVKTIEFHRAKIREKLGVTSLFQLVNLNQQPPLPVANQD
jgi:FixJ family two-component response regulator